MEMSKKFYWIIPLCVVVTPIIVNYILTREIVFNYDVAGTGVDWICFYGSFLGSGLSAFVAYYILLKTVENTNKENIKNQKKEEYDKLCDDLSARLAKIEVMEVYRVLYYPAGFNIKAEMDRLTDLLFAYKEMSNSSALRYGLESDDDSLDFYNEYNKLIGEICTSCAQMIQMLSNYLPLDNDKLGKDEKRMMQESLIEKISSCRYDMNRINALPSFVFEKAKRYCKVKKQELDKLYCNPN